MSAKKDNQLIPANGSSRQFGLNGAPNGEKKQDNAQLDFSQLWGTIKRGKWVILITSIVVAGAVTAYTFTLTPVYEASSIVSVTSETPNQLGVYSVAASRGLSAEVGTLRNSIDIATRVVNGLRERAEVGGNEHFPVLFDESGNERPEMEIVDDVLGMTSFGARQEQGMIEISVSSENPEQAASIANLFAAAYEEFDVESSRASIRAARSFLESQLDRREHELAELEAQWASFAQTRRLPVEGYDGQRLVDQYVGLEGRRDELEFQLQQEEGAVATLRAQKEQYEPSVREDLLGEQEMQAKQGEVNALQQRIAEINAEALQYYINNPNLEGNQERIEREFPQLAERLQTKAGLEARKDELMDQLVTQRSEFRGTGQGGAAARVAQLRGQITDRELRISGLRAQIAGIDNIIQSYEGRLHNIPQETIEREQIERRVAQAERFYNMFMEDLQRTIVAEESELGSVRLVRQAFVPAVPVSPNLRQNIILGLLLGIGFGIGLAFLRDASDRRFRKPEDLQTNGYSLVGVIPRMDREIKTSFKGKETIEVDGRNISTRLLPLINPWSPIAENYRLVRTNLRYGNNGHPPQVLLVTSPEISDGKTTSCVNLAITIAQSGLRTVLIDADLRKPAAHKLLDLPNEPGLAEVLDRKTEWVKTVQKTEVTDLHFIAAGHTTHPPAEALGSDYLADIIGELREVYDIVIIDSPPVLAVSDPVLLATQADTTLVVVSADRTDQKALEVTKRTLEAVGVHIGGVIFNRYEAEKDASYGYGYGYGYGDGYNQGYTVA